MPPAAPAANAAPHTARTRPAVAGFTLIEILVTILILGIILTLLYSVLVSTLGSKQKIERISKREKIRAGIVRRIGTDLHAVYTYSTELGPPGGGGGAAGNDGESEGGEPPTEPPSDPTTKPPEEPPEEAEGSEGSEGEDTSADAETFELPRIEGAFVGQDKGEGDTLTFLTTWDIPATDDAPPSDFSRITYAVQSSEESGFLTLFRGVAPFPEGTGGGEARFAEIYDRILVFDLQYLTGEDWVDRWEVARPPQAVRLTLQFLTEDDDPEAEPPPASEVSFTIPTS